MFFQRVSIVGLGLLGGSWALALKKNALSARVRGCDSREVLERALALQVIDEAEEDPVEAVRHADLVILATPVGVTLDLLPKLHSAAAANALITDLGSTKRLICERAKEVFCGGSLFLGGHPIAGKERSGLEHAEASLFRNARYALVPLRPEDLSDHRVKSLSALITQLGALPFVCDPAAHDRAVAFLSHLPQLVSTGLASLIAEHSTGDFLPLEFAGPGFRDVTRLAESPYPLWRDICLTNLDNIESALTAVIQKLDSIRLHLTGPELEHDFKRALETRERLRSATKPEPQA
jgi:prephenate dehydrogenase